MQSLDPRRARLSHRICVFGLWHLGSVTAACLASRGFPVVGLDLDTDRITRLSAGQPPVAEPGLAELIERESAEGRLSFTDDARAALAESDILWVTFDTPVDDDDHADPDWVRQQLQTVRRYVQAGTLILVSSQVPVGFTAALERDWQRGEPSLQFACSPENLRLGQAIDVFLRPDRIVVGVGRTADRPRLERLFEPLEAKIEWMSLESAEMTKHALNGFLALSIAYTNELARISELVGADATEVERGLRSEPRIGPRAYVSPGPPFAGGTLARDVRILAQLAAEHGLPTPIMEAIWDSNRLHQSWVRDRVAELIAGVDNPRVALLGLTYKPGTDTLRRSAALELAQWLSERQIAVKAFDPAISRLPEDMNVPIHLAGGLNAALAGADVAVLATAWPEFRSLTAEQIVGSMRHPRLVDQTGFLGSVASDPRITYVRVGRPRAGPTVET